jgi:hypothetical protein
MNKETIFKMQVQEFYSGSAIQIIQNTYNLLDYEMDRWLPFEHMSVNAWKERIPENMDRLNAETSTEDVWRECWLKASGGRYSYQQAPDGSFNIPLAYPDHNISEKEFNDRFNLYPLLDNGKVNVWEFNGTKVVFALLYNVVAWDNSAIRSGGLQRLFDRTPNLLNPLKFESFYAELQDYKYNQKQAAKYEVVWTEERPPSVLWAEMRPILEADKTIAEWFDNLGLKIWTCEVNKI